MFLIAVTGLFLFHVCVRLQGHFDFRASRELPAISWSPKIGLAKWLSHGSSESVVITQGAIDNDKFLSSIHYVFDLRGACVERKSQIWRSACVVSSGSHNRDSSVAGYQWPFGLWIADIMYGRNEPHANIMRDYLSTVFQTESNFTERRMEKYEGNTAVALFDYSGAHTLHLLASEVSAFFRGLGGNLGGLSSFSHFAPLESGNGDVEEKEKQRDFFYRISFPVKRVLAILGGLNGWIFGYLILGHGWNLVSFNRNWKDIRAGERLTLVGGLLIMWGTAAILMGIS